VVPCALLIISCFLALLPPRPTLFPYTTLFRSLAIGVFHAGGYVIAGTDPFSFDGFVTGYGGLLRLLVGLPDAVPDWVGRAPAPQIGRHTSELQSPDHIVCRLLLEKKKMTTLQV